MTEIPEHLLKRSRERRAAAGGGGDSGGGETPGGAAAEGATTPAKAAAAPAPSMPAHPAPVEPTPAAPPSPMVEAYRKRRKIPFWAMPVLAIIPVWAYVYVGTLSPPPEGEGPEVLGAELFAGNGCGGCHGAGGGGGVGPAFTGGAIYETFPAFETHMQWVHLGSAGGETEVGDTYGATDKPVGGGMPAFDQLSDQFFVVYHERLGLGGENPSEQDLARMEAAATLFFENPEMTLEDVLTQVDEMVGPAEDGGEGGGIEGQGNPELDPSTAEDPAGTDDAEPVNP